MKETAVAKRYASAFVEVIKEPEALESTGRELGEIAKLFEESRILRNVILNPAIPAKVKQRVLDDVLEKSEVSDRTAGLVKLVLRKDRMNLLRDISEEFEKLSFQALGKVRVDVSSAMELTDDEREAVSKKLSAITGKEAVVSVSVDPSLIGGIVAKIGSYVYDGSVKNQLRALKVGLR